MNKLEFFKKYCELNGLSKRYAIGGDGNITFLDGTVSSDVEYEGRGVVPGELYSVGAATCGHDIDGTNLCTIGNPQSKCIKNGAYSKNKCAVYWIRKIDIDSFVYNLSFEQFKEMAKGFSSSIHIGTSNGTIIIN